MYFINGNNYVDLYPSCQKRDGCSHSRQGRSCGCPPPYHPPEEEIENHFSVTVLGVICFFKWVSIGPKQEVQRLNDFCCWWTSCRGQERRSSRHVTWEHQQIILHSMAAALWIVLSISSSLSKCRPGTVLARTYKPSSLNRPGLGLFHVALGELKSFLRPIYRSLLILSRIVKPDGNESRTKNLTSKSNRDRDNSYRLGLAMTQSPHQQIIRRLGTFLNEFCGYFIDPLPTQSWPVVMSLWILLTRIE